MKKLSALLFLFASIATFAQVKWMTLEEATVAQKITPKKIIIDFYADWCAPCKIMDQETFGHPVISSYLNENYYMVKFNVEEKREITVSGRKFGNSAYKTTKAKNAMHDFTKYMNVNAVPSIVFLDAIGNPITILQGALTPREIEPYLKFIANDDYKKITTRDQWEAYQKKFKSNIKN